MNDDQWLRKGLRDAVPEPSPSPQRAAAAVGRARAARRRMTTLIAAGSALAVTGVIGAAVLLPPTSGDRSPSDRSSTGGPLPDDSCPPAPDDVHDPEFFDEPQADVPSEVPEGAVSARLCAGNGNRLGPPADTLTEGVNLLVDTVNGLPRAEKHLACTYELGNGYRIVFGYSDGSGYQVSGALYGCESVIVGSEQRQGADTLLKEYGALLRQQRQRLEPPALNPEVAGTIACDGQVPAPAIAMPQDLQVAVLCVRTPDGFVRSRISTEDLGVLREDLVSNVRRVPFPSCPDASEVTVVGLTVWGELVALSSVCGTSQLAVMEPWGTSTWPRSWLPGQSALQILDDLASRAR